MKTAVQLTLGFDQIRAAVVGGHDINEAWGEIPELMGDGERDGVLVGALGCLMFCIEVLERAEPLPEFEGPLQAFLHGGPAVRHAACTEAAKTKDFKTLCNLVSVMANVIQRNTDRIVFKGRIPELR